MKTPFSPFVSLYDKILLKRPKLIILLLLTLVSILGYKAKDFRLDASAETLVLENDKDLKYSRLIDSRYGVQDYLIVTYSPKEALFSDDSLIRLTRFRNELRKLKRVTSVLSILDSPLLESPPRPIKELATRLFTLESPETDRKLAEIEFQNSPLYQNLLVSTDLKTTALIITFKTDSLFFDLLARRDGFREKETEQGLSPQETAEFNQISKAFQQHRDKMRRVRHDEIVTIRKIMSSYDADAETFLGGVSMIADDMINFIKSDLKIFGLGILVFLIVTLSIIFRELRWIALPMLCCAFSGISMIGLLGTFGWEVTVISSNFISLQLIITMAIAIHLTVRYRGLVRDNPQADQHQLVLNTVRLMITPCLYATLTTIAGFGSLLLCNIRPVINFGWMMSSGILVSLVVTFLFFPSALMLMKRRAPRRSEDPKFSVTFMLAKVTDTFGNVILVGGAVIFVLSGIGISRLVVENSFIDYFKKSTEIYQGMKVIDQNMGGTIPLDVIVDMGGMEKEKTASSPAENAPENSIKGDEAFDEFKEFDKVEDDKKYWFTSEKMTRVVKIHGYLDALPETGKVLSLGTMIKIAEKLNKGKPLDHFALALLYSELPDKFKKMVLTPYVSVEHDQVRISVRVKDSLKGIKRNALLKRIQHELTHQLGLPEENVHLTGVLVLYNNMLQSLFRSQILTIGIVVLALMAMFLVLFRSFIVACIAILPNLLAVGFVLGIMGWLSIPLDMMTITIAAISIGIAVDNTIHYIYRFKEELRVDGKYMSTVYRCHGSIGYAIYYTSITIIIGFSILALSNFIPSIYFGLLTGLAMLTALTSALTLLPKLIVVVKPFGYQTVSDLKPTKTK